MIQPVVVAMIASGAIVGIMAWIGWRATSRTRGRLPRLGWRVLGFLALLLVWNPIGRAFLSPMDVGTWRCLVCADEREEARYGGLLVWTGPPATPEEPALEAKRYTMWFDSSVGLPHRHERWPVGCHASGLATVACAFYRGEMLFGLLPSATDQVLAVEIAQRIARATPERRRAMLLAFDRSAFASERDGKSLGAIHEVLIRTASEWRTD